MFLELMCQLKEQFGCCVKILNMISDQDKIEAIQYIKTVLAEFDLNFKANSDGCKEEYFEESVKKEEEEDVKPDASKISNADNAIIEMETLGKRKRDDEESYEESDLDLPIFHNYDAPDCEPARLGAEKNRKNNFKCAECPATFKKKALKERHMLIHTGERPFICEICMKSFSRKDKLQKHSRTYDSFVHQIDCKPDERHSPIEELVGDMEDQISLADRPVSDRTRSSLHRISAKVIGIQGYRILKKDASPVNSRITHTSHGITNTNLTYCPLCKECFRDMSKMMIHLRTDHFYFLHGNGGHIKKMRSS